MAQGRSGSTLGTRARERASTRRMIGRGLLRRCPRCGARHVFRSWFAMVDRCPGCRLEFERENDFFLGAYVINLGVTEGLLLLGLFAYIFAAVNNDDLPVAPVLAVAVVLAVVGPLAFFPFSRTIWSAIDLAMRPVPFDDPPGDAGPGDGTVPPG